MKRYGWPALLLTLVALCGTLGSAPAGAQARRPNIVFILADDLGYTDLASYGSRYYETPHIDRMAAEGLKFTDAHTAGPNCAPTRAALLSGQYGPRTGVYTVGGEERWDLSKRPLRPVENVQRLPVDKITLAQSLKSAGYATAMFGKWHLGGGSEYHPSRRGFDEALVSEGRHFGFQTTPRVEHDKDQYLADFLTDRAVDFIERHRSEPFFLYLPHFGVHSPHEAKPELIRRFKDKEPVEGHHSPKYAAMIASVDESVGRVMATLDELKLAENTLVIFSSDNGGVGGYSLEGIRRAGNITDNAPLRGGKGMLYEGGIRVPQIFRWKGKIPAGRTTGYLTTSVDLYPTLLEIAGGKPPVNYVLDGTSYGKVLTSGGKGPGAPPAFWHFPGYLGSGKNQFRTTPAGAIREGDWKLLEFFEDGRLELYNLREDIGETRDRAADQPKRVEALHARLQRWREEIAAPMPEPNLRRRDRS